MTHSRIQNINFFVFLSIFMLAEIAVCDGVFKEKETSANSEIVVKSHKVTDENSRKGSNAPSSLQDQSKNVGISNPKAGDLTSEVKSGAQAKADTAIVQEVPTTTQVKPRMN